MKQKTAKLILSLIYFIRGEKVWKVLADIERNQFFDDKMLKNYQVDKLQKIIFFCSHEIPYYKEAFKDVWSSDVSIRSVNDLRKLPILTKDDIVKFRNRLQVQSSSRRVSIRKTSGSTGTPLILAKDRETTAFMDAVMYRSYSWHGIKPGDRQLRIWGSEIGGLGKFKELIKDKVLNRIRISAFDLGHETIIEASKRILKFKPRFVYGYAQSVYEVARILLEGKIDLFSLNIKAVIVTGEMISDWKIDIINKAFCCQVVNEYGCTECGIIAIECEYGKMHIIADGLIVEILSTQEFNNTEEGSIVITELNNMYSPLIRYSVGDRAILATETCSCGRSFPIVSKIKGRSDDFIIFPNGRRVDPYVVEYILKEIPSKNGHVTQFFVCQETLTKICIKIVGEIICQEDVKQFIKKKWISMYGAEIHLVVEVEEKLHTNISGKLSCFESKIGSIADSENETVS